jgi:hypothetical protein
MIAQAVTSYIILIEVFHSGPSHNEASLFTDFITEQIKYYQEWLRDRDPSRRFPTPTFRDLLTKKFRERDRLLTNWQEGRLDDADRDLCCEILQDEYFNLPNLDINSVVEDDTWGINDDILDQKNWCRRRPKLKGIESPTTYRRYLLTNAFNLAITDRDNLGLIHALADYLSFVAEHRPEQRELEQRLTSLLQEENELKQTVKTGVASLATMPLSLAELIILSNERGLPLDVNSLIRRFIENPERASTPYWLCWWLLGLYQELKIGLQASGLSTEAAIYFLERLILAKRMTEVKELFKVQVPRLPLTVMNRSLWLREIVRLAMERGTTKEDIAAAGGLLPYLQLPGVTEIAETWLAGSENGERLAHFTATIAYSFNDWLGTSFSSPANHIRERAIVHITGLRSERCALKQVAAQTAQSAEPMVATLTGCLYFPRLNPEASADDERSRLEQILERRAFEIVARAFEQTEQLTRSQWGFETQGHLARCLEKISWPNLGDPARIADQLFDHLTTPSTRTFQAYADGVNNFHPAGGSRDYYLVCRILNLSDLGRWLVWRYAKTADEQRR